MTGGGGNDTYIIDNAGDLAIETAGGGTADHVKSSVTYAAGAQHIERITLAGTAAINATGQGLDNIITGNAAANGLDGAGGNDWLDGGLGADRMIGGTGNDTFIVDNRRDEVVENAGGGAADEVRSAIDYTLGSHVENLTLTGTAGIDGFGNGLDNIITGNAGANRLRGGLGDDRLDGSAGSDILNGGLGRDNFVFTTALGSGNVDVIQDFSHASDSITLDNAIFVGLANGALAASAFKDTGHGAAIDSSDPIIYNSSNGDLFFDQDGSGGNFAAIKFAHLDGHMRSSGPTICFWYDWQQYGSSSYYLTRHTRSRSTAHKSPKQGPGTMN